MNPVNHTKEKSTVFPLKKNPCALLLTVGVVFYLLMALGLTGCGPTKMPFFIPGKLARESDQVCRQGIAALADGDRVTLKKLGLKEEYMDEDIAKADLIATPIDAIFWDDFLIGRSYARQYRVKERGNTSIFVTVDIKTTADDTIYISYFSFDGGKRGETK